ncbi:MAG: SWIM zinc finger family protein [Bryobacterales bacterium]|nr:SWIM zinc finger family protein [Bryobacterales bacterium]
MREDIGATATMKGCPMSLFAKLAFRVDKSIQWKGQQLFRRNSVHRVEATPYSMVCQVQGSALYEVGLFLVEGTLEVLCTCPAFEKWGPCKHTWAAILEADRRGALADASKVSALRLVAGSFEDYDDDEDDEDFGIDDAETEAILQQLTAELWETRKRGAAPKPALVPKPPPVPLWREQLDGIARMVRDQELVKNRNSWPPGFEVAYVVDVPASNRKGSVVLKLESRNRKKNGDWSVFKDLRVSVSEASALPDPNDAELVAQLAGGQSPYSYNSSYYASSGSERMLPGHLALKLLPAMAMLTALGAPQKRILPPTN